VIKVVYDDAASNSYRLVNGENKSEKLSEDYELKLQAKDRDILSIIEQTTTPKPFGFWLDLTVKERFLEDVTVVFVPSKSSKHVSYIVMFGETSIIDYSEGKINILSLTTDTSAQAVYSILPSLKKINDSTELYEFFKILDPYPASYEPEVLNEWLVVLDRNKEIAVSVEYTQTSQIRWVYTHGASTITTTATQIEKAQGQYITDVFYLFRCVRRYLTNKYSSQTIQTQTLLLRPVVVQKPPCGPISKSIPKIPTRGQTASLFFGATGTILLLYLLYKYTNKRLPSLRKSGVAVSKKTIIEITSSSEEES